jgi:hypothetical protein
MIAVALIAGLIIGISVSAGVALWVSRMEATPPLEQNFHWTSVGLQRADPQVADALFQQQIFRQMAKGFFEIGY